MNTPQKRLTLEDGFDAWRGQTTLAVAAMTCNCSSNKTGNTRGMLSDMLGCAQKAAFQNEADLLLTMDDLGIYDDRIFQLCEGVCSTNKAHAAALVKAAEIGVISRDNLNRAIDNGKYAVIVCIPEVIGNLKEKLGDKFTIEEPRDNSVTMDEIFH